MAELHDVVMFTATVVDLHDDGTVLYEISDENGVTLALFDAPAKHPMPRFPTDDVDPEGSGPFGF